MSKRSEKIRLTGASTNDKLGAKIPVNGFNEALDLLTKSCEPCGCNSCNGISTMLNATTGELMGIYITGTDPYTLVIEPYDTAWANAEALRIARS